MEFRSDGLDSSTTRRPSELRTIVLGPWFRTAYEPCKEKSMESFILH